MVLTGIPRLPLVLLSVVLWLAGTGHTAEVDVRFITVGQGYQTQTTSGDVLDRRRLSEWVLFRAGSLLGDEKLSLDLSLRLGLELGLPSQTEGAQQADLLQAVLRWRDVFGRVDFYLGRQVLLDEIDFMVLDGVRSEIRLPLWINLRLVAGFLVNDRSMLGGDWLQLAGNDQRPPITPVIGAGLWFRRQDWWVGLDYRRAVLWQDGWPLDQDRIGGSGSLRLLERRLGFDGGASFDLLHDDWTRLRADGWFWIGQPGQGVRVTAGYLRDRPLFAGDSIFNFFSPAPFSELHAELRIPVATRLDTTAAFHRRVYGIEGGNLFASPAGWTVLGGRAEGRLDLRQKNWIGLALLFEDGSTGQRWLLAPQVHWEIVPDQLQLEGRGVVSSFSDPLQTRQHALSVGGSAVFTWRFGTQQALLLLGEINGNRIQPLCTRLMVVVDLAFHFGSGGFK